MFATMKSLSLLSLLSLISGVLSHPTPQHPAKDTNGAVASEINICSSVGIDLMKKGGNAADALVGTVLCVGTVGMYHSGLGGGGFMLVRSPKGKYEFIDFREMAPAASYEEMYVNKTELSIFGGMAR